MKYVADEDIYAYYLGERINFHKSFISLFREEKNPSMTFIRMGDGAVLWRDWGDGNQTKPESSIKFVMKIYNCSFNEALEHIKQDLGNGDTFVSFYRRDMGMPKASKKKDIQIRSRNFDENDTTYWGEYGISIDTLNLYNVIPISRYFINNFPIDQYDGIHPLYAYKMSKDGQIYYKIYNPLTTDYKKKWRWNGTDDILMGYDQLPLHGEMLIITKSMKDIMVLYEMGYAAVSMQSESTIMDTIMFASLKRRFDHIIVLYDNDATGIKRSDKLIRAFGLKQIFIPKISDQKDISDYVKQYSMDKGKDLMRELLNSIGL